MRSRMRLTAALTVLGGLALSLIVTRAPDSVAAAVPEERPNVILLVLDDATVADVKKMPRARRLLADEGVTFRRNYTPFPHCCPARATILSGLYPHNHHVLDINPPYGGFDRFDDQQTLATYLDPTYRTAMVGKYLNKFDEESVVSPGWDFFQVPVTGVYHYLTQQQMAVDGSVSTVTDEYLPLRHADQLMDFIEQRSPSAEPYFGYLGWIPPHNGSPADRRREPRTPYVSKGLRGTYEGAPLPTSPSFDERRVGDKRDAMQRRPRLSRRDVRHIAYTRAQRRESLVAVDQKIEEIVDLVTERGELDSTYFILTSDNGFMEGQHRIPSGKLQAYEESAAVPLIIRGPGFEPGTRYGGVTGLQDLVPTILDLTGTPLPDEAPAPDGVSLVGLLSGEVPATRAQVIEIADNSRTGKSRRVDPPWLARGIVTGDRWKYVEYPGTGEVEMFDLARDPHELRSLDGRPKHAVRQQELHDLLVAYQDCAGVDCRS